MDDIGIGTSVWYGSTVVLHIILIVNVTFQRVFHISTPHSYICGVAMLQKAPDIAMIILFTSIIAMASAFQSSNYGINQMHLLRTETAHATPKFTKIQPRTRRIYTTSKLFMSENENEEVSPIEKELERLQQILTSIEALEERNKAQIDSFVDEQDQWESMDESERQLLESKSEVEKQMEKMTEELMQMWMGAKSMDG